MDKEPTSSIIIYLTNHLEPTIISNLKYPIYSSDTDIYYIYDGDHQLLPNWLEKFLRDFKAGGGKNECSSKS